jgi:quinoprotein glucose dehydrogenase
VVATGFGVHFNYVGHDLHGLRLGPDGRLWFSLGDRGLDVVTKEGRHLQLPDCGAVLRCELDGSDLELFHTGLRNPQELAFDDAGDLFTCDNNSDSGDQARLVHVVEGGESGWSIGWQWIEGPTPRGRGTARRCGSRATTRRARCSPPPSSRA